MKNHWSNNNVNFAWLTTEPHLVLPLMDNGSMTGCHSTPAIWHQRNTIRFLNTSGERWINNKHLWERFASSQLVAQTGKQESLRQFLRRWSNIGPLLDSVYLADYEDYIILYTLTDWQIVYRVLLIIFRTRDDWLLGLNWDFDKPNL